MIEALLLLAGICIGLWLAFRFIRHIEENNSSWWH